MPFSQKLCGDNNGIRDCRNGSRDGNCLTPQQTDFVYRKVELGSLINKETIREEFYSEAELDKIENNKGDKNQYRELIVNNACKIENTLSQMEHWLIFSNVINYVQYNKNPQNSHSMIIEPVNTNRVHKEKRGKSKNESSLRVNLTDSLDRSKEKYLDKYEGIKSEILNTTRFDENSDLSTTYLGKINATRDKDLAIEEKFPITEQGYTVGKLLDGTECQILLDTGVSKSFMSKSYYLHCKSFHSLPKFASGNGQYVSILFVIPIIIEISGHRFKIYMLVSEIYKNVDIIL